jgi:hypothetical protein
VSHVAPDEPALLRPRRERARFGAIQIATLALGAITVLALGAAGFWVLSHQQRVADQITVWQYDPDATIAAYADRADLSDDGRFLFYASRPVIEAGDQFDETCATEIEGVGILGCYVGDERRIYLFDVTDDRLDGIEEVVAAHEMLHAAWDRMSDEERARLAPLLEAEAAVLADDADFAATLEFYAEAEPGERLNELHSIIGTEFIDVGEELETYYGRYFTDRTTVTALHAQSNGVFTGQQQQIDDLVAQIQELESGIDTDYASYNAGYDALNTDIAAFNARAEGGEFTTQEQFDSERVSLIDRQSELDTLYVSISERVTRYDTLVAQLDTLNAEVAELNESINIKPRGDAGLEE